MSVFYLSFAAIDFDSSYIQWVLGRSLFTGLSATNILRIKGLRAATGSIIR